jgi:type I restriction enzyme R subunit
MICHIAFDQPALTKKERANNVRKRNYFTKYNDQARQVLDALLDKYADQGIEPIEDVKILQIPPFNQMGSIIEIIQSFGSVEAYTNALKELEIIYMRMHLNHWIDTIAAKFLSLMQL